MFLVQTINNAGAVATIDFTGLGAYPYYKLKCTSISPATGTPSLDLLVHTGGAWASANYQYSLFFYTASGGSGNGGSTSASSILMTSGTPSDGASFELETDDVNTTTKAKFIRGKISGSSFGYDFQGSYQGGTTAVDGLRVQYATGNIAAGSICTLYGMPM